MDHNELTNRRVYAIVRAHDCTIDDVHPSNAVWHIGGVSSSSNNKETFYPPSRIE